MWSVISMDRSLYNLNPNDGLIQKDIVL